MHAQSDIDEISSFHLNRNEKYWTIPVSSPNDQLRFLDH